MQDESSLAGHVGERAVRGGQEEDEQQLGAAEISRARPAQEVRAIINAEAPVRADEPAGEYLLPCPIHVYPAELRVAA